MNIYTKFVKQKRYCSQKKFLSVGMPCAGPVGTPGRPGPPIYNDETDNMPARQASWSTQSPVRPR